MKPLKPWLSFSDQLEQLRERGLQVEDRAAALGYLKRLGYYRLSGYWYPLREIDRTASARQNRPVRDDRFVPGSRFEDVVKLYVFDKKLRLLALDALERIEMAVRVDVAHLLGQRDPRAHENPDCLHGKFARRPFKAGPDKGKTEHDLWLVKYSSLLHRARKEPFVAHHMAHYGSLPIWVAIEVLDFGALSKLFSGMAHEDQETIAAIYGAPTGKAFAQWLRSLNFIRNVSAHHSRLWNINVVEISTVPEGWSKELKPSRPFFYFCLIQQLMRVICPNSSWGDRYKALLAEEFPRLANQQLSLKDMGVVEGWENWPVWRKQ